MPNRDGYELTAVLRKIQQEDDLRVPIVALTANAFLREKDKCLAVGMDDYLSKSVELETLKEDLVKWAGQESQFVAVELAENTAEA